MMNTAKKLQEDTYTRKEIVDLLNFETDVSVMSVTKEQFNLEYAPFDVSPDLIRTDGTNYFMNLPDVLVFVQSDILGAYSSSEVLYDNAGRWTHVAFIK